MSRESFIRSEDKEFEVTFREVRNWDEYSDLDFEADTAPLTQEEAGNEENVNEDNIWDDSEYVVNEGHEESDDNVDDTEEEPDNESSDEPPVVDSEVVEDETVEEETVEEEPEEDEEPSEGTEDEATEVEEASKEENPEDEEVSENDEDEETPASQRGSSKESTVVLPVVEEDFNMGPAWEEDPEDDEADADNLELGEPAADTEAFGTSLENLYEADEKPEFEAESEEEAEEEEDTPAPTEALNLAQLVAANNEDAESIDTFEAISNEDESLNKAELVEEIAPDYSADSQPHTIPVEPGEYLSFDGIELDTADDADDEEEPVATADDTASTDDSEDDGSLSLELDYSELDDQDK